MQTAVLAIGIGILGLIAYTDVRARRIPNAASGAIAALGGLRMTLLCDLPAVGHTVAATAVVSAASLLLFRRGVIGGGDAKLAAAMTLLVGYADLFGFYLLMSLLGGAVALVILVQDELRTRLWPVQGSPAGAVRARPTVPYGLAIAAAGAITLILQGPVPR